jgi:hypothetical protein
VAEVVARSRLALNEAELMAHPVWYVCGWPDDFHRLTAWGLPADGVREIIRAQTHGDEPLTLMVALPPAAADRDDPRLILSAMVRTAGGHDHVGYTVGNSVALFFCGGLYSFQSNYSQGVQASAARLAQQLHNGVLPLTVTLTATGESFSFDGT